MFILNRSPFIEFTSHTYCGRSDGQQVESGKWHSLSEGKFTLLFPS